MSGLLAIYLCPVHGEVLEDNVESTESIDAEHDEVYPIKMHGNGCWCEVRPKLHDGHPCYEEVSEDRWFWYVNAYGADDPDDNDSDGLDWEDE